VNLSDLRTALKERREDFSPSDAKLNRKINQAYLDICSRRKWGWLRREHTVNTYATQADTNCSISDGSRYLTRTSDFTNVAFGKRVIIGDDSYRVVNVDSTAQIATLDRPYIGTALVGGSVTFVYDDVALPVGGQTIVEAVLFTGSASAPLSLTTVQPGVMAHRGKNTYGQPSTCSVIRKEPLPTPRAAPTAVIAGGVSGSLTSGATYKYWISHIDKQSGAESALSPSVSVTLGSTDTAAEIGDTGTGLAPVTGREDFYIRLYRSTANGSVPFMVPSSTIEFVTSIADFNDTIGDQHLGPRGPDSASTLFLNLYPAPNSVYQVQITYQAEAVLLDGDNDRPLFDATYTSVLLDGAELLMLNSSDEQPRSNYVRQRYEAGIKRMIDQDRLSFQNRVLIGRSGRRLRGGRTWWYGSLGS